MSFGFSVGDFIAVGKLISDITSSLQTIGGAKSEYQELIREFNSLSAALRYLDQLQNKTSTPSKLLDSIKCAALSCRYPLEAFLSKIKKYEASLSPWNQFRTGKTVADKLRWTFGEKDDIRRLQTYLNVHVGTINILLVEHGLERMDMYEKRAEEDASQIRQQLDDANTALKDVAKTSAGEAVILRTMHSMLGNLWKVVCGEVKTSLQQVSQVVNKVCVSTQQIYVVVLEIRDSLATVDTRWTFFQAPLAIEDARGIKFPFPAEYDFRLLDAIIRDRFRNGPGASDVRDGNYELCKTKRRSEQITSTSRLLPGTEITMAVIIPTPMPIDATCPIRSCSSTEIAVFPGGGFTCGVCCVWFDQATKERQRIEELFDFEDNDDAKDIGDTDSKPDNIVREVKPGSDDQGTDGLRNVRWAVDQTEVSSEWSSSSPRSSISESPEPENMSTKRKRRTVGQLLHQQASLVSSSDDEDSSVMDADDNSGFNTNPARTGNHSLQDYQMQMMLLEQQNKKRLLMARQEQDNMAQSGFDGQYDAFDAPDGEGNPLYAHTPHRLRLRPLGVPPHMPQPQETPALPRRRDHHPTRHRVPERR